MEGSGIFTVRGVRVSLARPEICAGERASSQIAKSSMFPWNGSVLLFPLKDPIADGGVPLCRSSVQT